MTLQKLLPFLLLLGCHVGAAQVYRIEQSVSVIENGSSLAFPWAGGLNSAQYNTMDVDQDGLEDLIVFDRSAAKINVFRNVGGAYEPTFDYAHQFPENLRNWILLRDYDCDGRKDLFASDPLGIRVYQNISDNEGLKWRLFNERGPQSPLLTKGFSANINLQINSSDIPSITDVDGDGDLDILNFRFTGSSTIEFHKNLSMERTGTCDSLQLERVTQSWGEFEQCLCEQIIFGEGDCSNIGGRTQHQAGKALLTFDIDNDGDQEAVISEEDCNVFNILGNEGTADEALMISNSISFPTAQNPVFLFTFPAAFYEDVDFDGSPDLLVAPNVASNIGFGVDFEQSNWLYKNTGSATNPSFQFVQRDFLQSEMLDFGENAAPAFYDYDGDGDLDLFVGKRIEVGQGFTSSLKLYENIGSATEPSFELKDPDFLNLSFSEFINIKPAFEDVDLNGTVDLVLSRTTRGVETSIVYFTNFLRVGLQFDTQPQLLFTLSNNVSTENFKLFDVDSDGTQDLLIGRNSGRLEYYKNIGTLESPNFVLEDQEFLGLGVNPFTINSSVDIADMDGDGNLDMVLGDDRGNFRWYSDFRSLIGTTAEALDMVLETSDQRQVAFNLGTRLLPKAVNLFNEDKPAIVVGTGQGGLNILRNTGAEVRTKGSTGDFLINICPNPILKSNQRFLTLQPQIRTRVKIVSIMGQEITDWISIDPSEDLQIDISNLPQGLYLVIAPLGDGEFVNRKFVVIN